MAGRVPAQLIRSGRTSSALRPQAEEAEESKEDGGSHGGTCRREGKTRLLIHVVGQRLK